MTTEKFTLTTETYDIKVRATGKQWWMFSPPNTPVLITCTDGYTTNGYPAGRVNKDGDEYLILTNKPSSPIAQAEQIPFNLIRTIDYTTEIPF